MVMSSRTTGNCSTGSKVVRENYCSAFADYRKQCGYMLQLFEQGRQKGLIEIEAELQSRILIVRIKKQVS